MRNIVATLEKRRRKRILRLLKNTDPLLIEKMGTRYLVPAFRRAAANVPAYRQILSQYHIDPQLVKDVDSFKKLVPVIDKKETFARFEIDSLCMKGSLDEMKLAMSSSGFSGIYSYGINTHTNYKRIATSIDTALDYVFNISDKETFLVNCIPMGVKVHTCLKIAETSVRSDMALAIIKKFSSKFDQTVIVSDPHFLKKIVEEGNEHNIPWKKLNISLISGEDWFSESFRSYLAERIDLDLDNPEGRLIGATMGIAELDLNLFHESHYSILIRRAAQENKSLRSALFGEGCKIAPLLFHYYPHRIFLEALPEEAEEKELVFSMLSPYMHIPLLRYNSRDKGTIISYNALKEILSQQGKSSLMPDLKLPLVTVGGRKDRCLEVGQHRLYPEEIKQGLYEDFQAAALTTGYFRLSNENGDGKLEIQMKKGVAITLDLKKRFERACLKYTPCSLPTTLYHYQDFPYGMELDYERKFKHI